MSSAFAQVIDNVQSSERNIEPAKHYKIGVNRPSTDALVSDDEMGLHVWNESRELVCNTLGGKSVPVFPRYSKIRRYWRIRTFRNRVVRREVGITDTKRS